MLEEFREKMHEARMKARVTLRELSVATGKEISYLAGIERGREIPDFDTIRKIEKRLGLAEQTLCELDVMRKL